MTVHGSKSELEWSRCHENRDNSPIDAPLTSRSHNFWSDRWISKFHNFSKTGSQDLSKGFKINLIHGLLKVVALKGPPPQNSCRVIKSPRHPLDRENTIIFWFLLSAWFFNTSLPFSKHPKKKHTHTTKNSKNTSKLLYSSLFTKNTGYCSYTQSPFPWFYIFNLGFWGVDLTF